MAKRFVFQIWHIEFGCGAFYNVRKARVMHVADFWKKVVLYLIIQPTHIPGQQTVMPRKIDCRIHLVDRPFILNDLSLIHI